ncbi:fluoroquinolone transport system ATP-binding protein [Anoxybacillus voinovskiensis]|uniref:Fluoroquinolone transport system ATP-binding protein n=1 Tax=Anoxybacteroides voinovskiense TaxID=230470 RepID=A0A840DZS6_9BACL|nr:ABC transporter ATP-binding protein [Anoxybacillus voinovskiensis]MBB4075478.1 fluoroquinolone transport system ATP-binding protein [Anoxybacillus voinovskiensis]GGJ79605.1 ABC transporter ATP-binding protein [Anoxybacillus voinovskiensis]
MMEIKELTYTYPKQVSPILKGLNFHVDKGEIFGLLGPSGAGKSTTQKILIGLLKGYKGSVQVDGKELSSFGRDYAETIGVAFEAPNFYIKMTAYENLVFFRSLYRRESEHIEMLLEAVGLKEAMHQRVSEFSKGMKMRLNFCRAFLHRPSIVFLDEPTSGLDPVNIAKIKAFLQTEAQKGKTIFITTHDMAFAESVCDRVAFIVDGEIVLIDSPKTLKVEMGERVVEVTYIEQGSKKTAVFMQEKLGENEEFLQLLREKEILTMHTKEATLEDIFVRVTGREIA